MELIKDGSYTVYVNINDYIMYMYHNQHECFVLWLYNYVSLTNQIHSDTCTQQLYKTHDDLYTKTI